MCSSPLNCMSQQKQAPPKKVNKYGAIQKCSRWGQTRLPKFKFSAKFPIGLHMILQIQIKEFENDCYIM